MVQGVLLDQFGVLHDGLRPYSGVQDAVKYLAEAGMRIVILSNSSRSDPPVGRESLFIVTSSCAIHDCLRLQYSNEKSSDGRMDEVTTANRALKLLQAFYPENYVKKSLGLGPACCSQVNKLLLL
jgi:hypothetical protein